MPNYPMEVKELRKSTLLNYLFHLHYSARRFLYIFSTVCSQCSTQLFLSYSTILMKHSIFWIILAMARCMFLSIAHGIQYLPWHMKHKQKCHQFKNTTFICYLKKKVIDDSMFHVNEQASQSRSSGNETCTVYFQLNH